MSARPNSALYQGRERFNRRQIGHVALGDFSLSARLDDRRRRAFEGRAPGVRKEQ